MKELKPEKIIEKTSNLKTGEIYKDEDDWKAKGVPKEDIRRDVKSLCQALIYFGKPSRLELQDLKPANNNLTKYDNNKRTDGETIT